MDIIQQYFELVGGWKILSIAILIVLDTILGIILAIKNKTFAWSKIADYLNTSVLMMFGGYLILGIAGMAEETLKIAVPVAMVTIDTKLIADVVNKFKAFGLPVKEE